MVFLFPLFSIAFREDKRRYIPCAIGFAERGSGSMKIGVGDFIIILRFSL
jgi:hypothetical protein